MRVLSVSIIWIRTIRENQSLLEKQFLGELLLRNEITHDYYVRDDTPGGIDVSFRDVYGTSLSLWNKRASPVGWGDCRRIFLMKSDGIYGIFYMTEDLDVLP